MPPRPAPSGQMSLLEWQAPQPVQAFPEEAVRAASIGARISRAVAATLRDSPLARDEVARRMADFLGEPVSVHVLDAYASQAREGHKIAACRLMALVHVTGDRRLLELLAEPFGWTVIDRKFLPLIELAAIHEHKDELARRADALRRQARAGGML